MKRHIMLFLFLIISTVSFGQDLTKTQKDSIRTVMNKIGNDDQKYRWQLMLGELDVIKLDSLKKLPLSDRSDRIKKSMKGEIGFSKQVRDSLERLQNELDSEVV